MTGKKTMAEEALERGTSTFRGHKTVWVGDKWVYADNMQPTPGWGGEVRPCAICGQKEWSGDGHVDKCLGQLPGVTNACCGHGDPNSSYVAFSNGVILRGFYVYTPVKESEK